MPRTVGQNAAFRSLRVGIRLEIFPVNASLRSFCSRFATISATAKRPTAITVKPMPSNSSGTPKV